MGQNKMVSYIQFHPRSISKQIFRHQLAYQEQKLKAQHFRCSDFHDQPIEICREGKSSKVATLKIGVNFLII